MAADGNAATKTVDMLPSIMTTEIATPFGKMDLYRQFLQRDGRLWNEDQVLQLEAGGDLRQYKDLLRDDHVKSTFEQRISAVTAATWSVQPGEEEGAAPDADPSPRAQEAADFVSANLKRCGFDDVTKLVLYCVFYGFSVSELLWDVIDWKGSPKFQWKAIKVRDRARFLFTPDSRCYLNTGAGDPDGKDRVWCPSTLEQPYFWIISTGDDYSDNPYGLGLAHQLYWLVRFKRDCIRWWMVYNEKYAMPTTVGTFPRNSTDDEKLRLLAALRAVLTENGVIVPDGFVLENLEAKRQGSSDYQAFCTFIDSGISKVVLSQTLTTQTGDTGGNRALGQVHEGVSAKIQKSDADLVCESLNRGPIAWLVQRNFGADCPIPIVKRDIEEKTDLTELATQLQLLDSCNFRPTLDFVQDNWGAEFEDLGPPPDPLALIAAKGAVGGPPKPGQKPGTKGKAGAAKAANDEKFVALFTAAAPHLFPDQVALDGALESLGTRMTQLSADLLIPLVEYAVRAEPVAVAAQLSVGLPEWKDEALRDAIAQVIFVAKTFGRSFPAAA